MHFKQFVEITKHPRTETSKYRQESENTLALCNMHPSEELFYTEIFKLRNKIIMRHLIKAEETHNLKTTAIIKYILRILFENLIQFLLF